MDLTFTTEQQTIAELATTILDVECSPERLRAVERAELAHGVAHRWPRDAWVKLAEAGLVGIGLPTRFGGGALGFAEVAVLIEQIARSAAPLPGFATLVLGALPIVEFGSEIQRSRWLSGVADGSVLLTGALVGENDDDGPILHASERSDGGYEVSGIAWYVPFGGDAAAVVTSVELVDGDRALAVVPVDADGVSMESLSPMGGEPSVSVRFDQVRLEPDGLLERSVGIGGDAIGWLRDRAVAATCVAQAGTCAGALALTASYVSAREQFGVKLATLQAVSQRAADAWIDTELVRLTAWTAVWRLSHGLDATEELAVAKCFTAEAGQRVVAAAQHLHGGIGMDLDYPVHRYFRWAKDHEQRLGGGSDHLAALGRRLART